MPNAPSVELKLMRVLKSISQYRMAQNVRNHAVMHVLVNGNGDICPICRDIFNDGNDYSRCTHCNRPYHLDCIADWFTRANSCPACRAAPADFTGVYRVGNNNGNLPLGPALDGVAPQAAALGQMNIFDILQNYNVIIIIFSLILGLLHFSRLLMLQRGQRGGSLYDCFVPTNKLKYVKDLEAEVIKQIKHTPDIKIEAILKLSLNELLQLLKDMGVSDTTISKITNINKTMNNRKTRNTNRQVNRASLRNRTLRNS